LKSYTVRLLPTNEQIEEFYKLSIIRNKLWNILVDIQNKEYETNKIGEYRNMAIDANLMISEKLSYHPELRDVNERELSEIDAEYNDYITKYKDAYEKMGISNFILTRCQYYISKAKSPYYYSIPFSRIRVRSQMFRIYEVDDHKTAKYLDKDRKLTIPAFH
jgi:hypothetical protein